jgi:hypothetical protein
VRFPEAVTVLRGPAANPFGDVPPNVEPERILLSCAFADGGTSEDTTSRGYTVGTTATIYLPYDADIRRTDRAEVRGLVWEVDGDPQRWRSPGTGRRAGCAVNLRSVRG